jgi:hypothetical protein
MSVDRKEAFTNAVQHADSYFYKPQEPTDVQEEIRKLNSISMESRRKMEELQRRVDELTVAYDKFDVSRANGLTNLITGSIITTTCLWLAVRGYRFSDPMTSKVRDWTTNVYLRRCGNTYTVFGLLGAGTVGIYVPSDFQQFNHASRMRDGAAASRDAALKTRHEIYTKALEEVGLKPGPMVPPTKKK